MPNTREKMIDERLDLVDAIGYAMRDWDDYIDECRDTGTPPIESFEDFIADGVLSAGYRKQEWISVKDRLPMMAEVGEFVLVYTNENRHLIVTCWAVHKHKDQIIAWMPLPQPPKGE